MGVDAYLTAAKVLSGHESIQPDFPCFKVLANMPVAILPVCVETVGTGYFARRNFLSNSEDVNSMLRFPQYSRDYQWVVLGDSDDPKIGLVILPRKDLLLEMQDNGLGCVPLAEHVEAWDQLTPGIWLFTDFSVCGMSDDLSWSGRTKANKLLTLSKPVCWRLYT